SANRQIGERLVLAQADAWRRLRSFIAAAAVKLPQLECFLARRQIQINIEERVISNLPKSVVGDFAVPMRLGTLPDAVVEHAQRRLELAGEDFSEMFNHGSFSHGKC